MMKRRIGILLAAVMAFGSCGSVFGAEVGASDEALAAESSAENEPVAEMILKMKDTFQIGEEYDDFNYSYTQKEGYTIWDMEWKSGENPDISINITVDNEGYISDYSKSFAKEETDSYGSVTKENAIAAAKAFMANAAPDYLNDVEFKCDFYKEVGNRVNRNGYSIEGTYSKNGVECVDGDFRIFVSRYNSEVTGFHAPDKEILNAVYPSSEKAVGVERAKEIYKNNSDVNFEYLDLYYNWYYSKNEDKQEIIKAQYDFTKDWDYIDALTGEVFCAEDYEEKTAGGKALSGGGGYASAETAADTGASLSEAEKNSILEKDSLISKEKAIEILTASGLVQDTSGAVCSLGIYRGDYCWNIRIENSGTALYSRIDAQKGRLLYYKDVTDYEYDESAKAEADVMIEKAGNYIKLFAEDIIDKTVAESERVDENWNGRDLFYVSYIRVENGIKYGGNGALFTFDREGRLINYSYEWNDSLKFESIDDAIDEDAAYDAFLNASEPKLRNVLLPNGTAKLVYVFNDELAHVNKYGEWVDYEGEVIKEKEIFEGYTDIESSEYRDVIERLFNCGYYIPESEFKPEENITPQEFGDFFDINYEVDENGCKFGNWNDKFYNDTLTRYDAAEILARDNFGSIMKKEDLNSVFRTDMFKDGIDPQYRAAAALCYGSGWTKPDENGCFNGSEILTRGEAAVLLYSYIMSKQ